MNVKQISLNTTYPTYSVYYRMVSVLKSITGIFSTFPLLLFSSHNKSFANSSSEKYTSTFRKDNKKKDKTLSILKIAGMAVLGFLIVFFLARSFIGRNQAQPAAVQKTQIEGAKSVVDIQKEFQFPINSATQDDEEGEAPGFSYILESAELRDEIVVQGQKATAVEGRTFLIINLKVKNDLSQSIQINTRNFIRLALDNQKDEWLAPDIHNDPVEIQAISTKTTRVGFPIDSGIKKVTLRIGEIDGEKEMVELSF